LLRPSADGPRSPCGPHARYEISPRHVPPRSPERIVAVQIGTLVGLKRASLLQQKGRLSEIIDTARLLSVVDISKAPRTSWCPHYVMQRRLDHRALLTGV